MSSPEMFARSADVPNLIKLFGSLTSMKCHIQSMSDYYENDIQIHRPLKTLALLVDQSLSILDNFEAEKDSLQYNPEKDDFEKEEMRKIILLSPCFSYISTLLHGFEQLKSYKPNTPDDTLGNFDTPAQIYERDTMNIKTGPCERTQCKLCNNYFENWNQLFYHDNCSHIHCIACVKKHLTTQIKAGGVLTLECPSIGCRAKVSPIFIYSYCIEEIMNKYKLFMLLAALRDVREKPSPISSWRKANSMSKSNEVSTKAVHTQTVGVPYKPAPPTPDRYKKNKYSKTAARIGKYAGVGVAVVTLGIPAAVVAAPVYGAYRVGKAIKAKRDVDKIPRRMRVIKKEDDDNGAEKKKQDDKEATKREEERALDRKEELEEEHRARVQTRSLGLFSRIRPMRN